MTKYLIANKPGGSRAIIEAATAADALRSGYAALMANPLIGRDADPAYTFGDFLRDYTADKFSA